LVNLPLNIKSYKANLTVAIFIGQFITFLAANAGIPSVLSVNLYGIAITYHRVLMCAIFPL